MDHALSQQLTDAVARHPALAEVVRIAAEKGPALLVGLAVLTFLAAGRLRTVDGRRGVAAGGVGALVALAVAQVIASGWDRARPYEAHADVHLLLARSPDPSFPSDHATGAYAIAFALLARNRPVGIVALLLATALSTARIASGTHYLSDVAGGAALGAVVAATLLVPAARRRIDGLADALAAVYELGLRRVAVTFRRWRPAGG